EREFRPRLGSPRADDALRRALVRGEISLQRLNEELAPGLIMETFEDCDRPQTIRLGKSWIKNRWGRKKAQRPVLLPPSKLRKWVAQQLYRLLTATIEAEFLPQEIAAAPAQMPPGAIELETDA